jgi:hypothetical protein
MKARSRDTGDSLGFGSAANCGELHWFPMTLLRLSSVNRGGPQHDSASAIHGMAKSM